MEEVYKVLLGKDRRAGNGKKREVGTCVIHTDHLGQEEL